MAEYYGDTWMNVNVNGCGTTSMTESWTSSLSTFSLWDALGHIINVNTAFGTMYASTTSVTSCLYGNDNSLCGSNQMNVFSYSMA